MRIRWGRVLVAFFILELIICGIIYMIIDFKTKQEINIIRNSYKAHTSEIMFDETKYTQEEQTLVYEPKNEVKNDVEMISKQYEVEYELVEAIIRHETGNRTSKAFKELNNPCGNMSRTTGKLIHYKTINDGYRSCANNLKNNYINQGLVTISEIGHKYAPVNAKNDPNGLNNYWISGVTRIYNQLKSSE